MGGNRHKLYLSEKIIQVVFMGGNQYKLYLWAGSNTTCNYERKPIGRKKLLKRSLLSKT